jgi:pilus assembly protein Flp/PilA
VSGKNFYVKERSQHGGTDMTTVFLRFLKDDRGATAIEYGLIAAGISVAIIATVAALGTNLNNTFSSVSGALTN